MTSDMDIRGTASSDAGNRAIGLAGVLGRQQPALGAFSVAGFPDERAGVDVLVAYARSGANLLEVGAPAADPWLDGPAIAAAHRRARRAKHGMEVTLATVRQVSAITGKPVVVMSYWATVLAYGPQRTTHDLAASGAAGCLIPDVPPEDVPAWATAAARAGISAPLLAGREASAAELTATCRAATGFVYAPAVAGQRTGYSDGLDLEALSSFVASIRHAAPTTPVMTGIGVSTPALAASVVRRPGVAGVVIGSPLIRAFIDGGLSKAAGLVAEFAASIAAPR
ncbi:tryptophan synthase subunit alpha [Streptomyces sp. 891-h]|uniref:tryptophan synthase subunit alpha n=1 Tax=Streptomyces sp. 891-h TaxID=2720714 RepID=UPI001FAA175A|nr:tryptophan synthase subunit alpha [Streptomyces sp. 891-h]UNZ21238.1 tryptophan synthase subunit alpha [Streptomyces sp. 891-h]